MLHSHCTDLCYSYWGNPGVCMIGYVFTLQRGRLNTGWDLCEHRKGTWTISFTAGQSAGPCLGEARGLVFSPVSWSSQVPQPPAWESITQLPVFLRAEREQDSASSEQTIIQPLLSLGRCPRCGVRGETCPTQPKTGKINPYLPRNTHLRHKDLLLKDLFSTHLPKTFH